MEEVTRGMNAEDALNMDLSPVQPRGDSSPILTDPQMERFHHERFRIQETSAEEWDNRSGGAVSNSAHALSSRGISNDPLEDNDDT